MKNKSKIIVADKPEIELLDSSDRRFLLDALSRGMSRRQALTWMMAAGVTAATAGNLFTQAGSVLAAVAAVTLLPVSADSSAQHSSVR